MQSTTCHFFIDKACLCVNIHQNVTTFAADGIIENIKNGIGASRTNMTFSYN